MAVLSDPDRANLCTDLMRDGALVAGSLSKTDLRAAVNAVDQWTDDNASAFNLAIPQPARGALSSRQKAAMLSFVVRRRFEIS